MRIPIKLLGSSYDDISGSLLEKKKKEGEQYKPFSGLGKAANSISQGFVHLWTRTLFRSRGISRSSPSMMLPSIGIKEYVAPRINKFLFVSNCWYVAYMNIGP